MDSIVRFARSQEILCQGRGSAANRAVCFVLGVTSIDPERNDLLFERFVSQERREPPDIDVDFEHERREEVIQWIYETYGRDRAALCATVIRNRARGAVRDVGKALGLTEDVTKALASQVWAWSDEGVEEKHAEELHLNLSDRHLMLTLDLARQLFGFPRHLSQHPGGFVLTQDRLDELVPIEPAAMEKRAVIEWGKDDIDALKFMKVDVLGLGMLGCMRRCFDLMREHKDLSLNLATMLVRQRPGSVRGVMFITIEDETSHANLVIWPSLFERQRRLILSARMISVQGKVQREGEVIHVVADRMEDMSKMLDGLAGKEATGSLSLPHGHGDGAKTGGSGDQREVEAIKQAARDIYVPEMNVGSAIRMRTRDFR